MNKDYFKNVCKLTAENSTCSRLQVGAVLVKEDRILSIGYNGVPSGQKHCIDIFKEQFEKTLKDPDPINKFEDWMKLKTIRDIHAEFSEKNEIHAEINCFGYASRFGIATDNCDLYVSISPCCNCAKTIIASGIKRVFYIEKYDRDTTGIEILENNNIECKQI